MHIPMPTKYCPKCQQHKEISLFGKETKSKDGLARTCKSCNYIGHKTLNHEESKLKTYADYMANYKEIDKSKYNK